MIEFKDKDQFIRIKEGIDELKKVALVDIHDCCLDLTLILVDKDLYHLLQQAMPHIGAIVEGE